MSTVQQNRLMKKSISKDHYEDTSLWMYFRQAIVLFVSSMAIIILTSQVISTERVTGVYLGQEPPGNTPVRFGQGIIPDDLHSVPVFTPDGKKIYYKAMNSEGIMVITEEKKGWSHPVPLFVNNEVEDSDDPCLDPSGTKLYFTCYNKDENREFIYYCNQDRTGNCIPKKPDGKLNSLDLHWQFTIAESQNIYFSSNGNLYCSEFSDGIYEDPYKLPETINTSYSECTPYVSPDESMLIFARSNHSKPDLFISIKDPDGIWQEARSLGPEINTETHHEMCPRITSDGKYLFFISSREGLFSAYWVDARVLNTEN